MSVDFDRSILERVNLDALIEQKTPVRLGKAYGTGEKRTRKGACPWCGGTDRFAVFVNDQPQRYKCGIHGLNGCGRHGDAIDFLREYEGLSFSDAVATLSGETLHSATRLHDVTATPATWQSDIWQRQVAQFCTEAEARLWNDDTIGLEVLSYLVGRGFSEETIKAAHLGAALHKDLPAVVIPWYDIKAAHYWRVSFRNIGPGWRYANYYGSSVSEGLYLADSLAWKRPVFLVEGEFDGLSIAQEAGNLVSVVATGSTGGSHNPRWLMRLANASVVFVAFDSEKGAEKSARYWLDALPNAVRWHTPIGKDANEMLQRELNIRLWVESALSLLSKETPSERFEERARALIEPVFGTCALRMFPAGSFTLEDRIAELREQARLRNFWHQAVS